ncbi:MAG: hypothetical protein IPL52_08695 [Flavobacteriales bacterium]|nr:hypothetical protein [Flavobacteriales bacterium]
MILRSACLLPFLLLVILTRAQSLDWVRTVGSTQQEIAYATVVGSDNAVITVGTFTLTVDLDPGAGVFNVTSNGSSDVFMQALDSVGNFLWGGAIGATGADIGAGVAADNAGNVYLTGRVSGTVDLDPGAGTFFVTPPNTAADAFVIKLDANGAFIWGRNFGGLNNDGGNEIAVDGAGNVITVGVLGAAGDLDPGPGTNTAGGNGGQDIFVQKMDANGNFIWGIAVGGTGNDQGFGVAVDAQDKILACGEFRNTVDFDPGAGVLARTSGGEEDAFVMKLDASGALQWAHGFGGTSTERAQAVAVGPDGGAVFTGRINSTTDFDPGAGVVSLLGDFSEPAFLAKLNSDGTFSWAFMLKSFLNEGMDLAVDLQNRVVLAGVFGSFSNSPLDLDPGSGTATIASNGGSDAFIASYTGAGNFLWGFGVGSAQNDIGHAVALGTNSRIVLAGEFRQTLDADPSPNTALVTPVGGQDAFTIQYRKPDCAGVFVDVRAVLEGAHTPDEFFPMDDALRAAGLIPLQEPYTALGFVLEEDAVTTALALSLTGSNAVVDWVLVELRSANDPSMVLRRRAALLHGTGKITGTDGVSPVGFCIADGNYHVAVRHRNHLGVMTAAPVAITAIADTVDLSDPATLTWGSNALHNVNGTMVMWCGNVLPDASVAYVGANNDRDPILVAVGGSMPTNTASGYLREDVNLDGTVKYVGADNDRDPILLTIGGNTPTATRAQQLP